MEKECRKCQSTKPLEEYHINKATKDGRGSWCKQCCTEETRRKRQDPNEKERWKTYRWRSSLKSRYGITEDEWNSLNAKQNGCAICGVQGIGGRGEGTRLAVDHNHATGKVRGLLCVNCNRGLGLFKDSQDILLAAAKYLASHQ